MLNVEDFIEKFQDYSDAQLIEVHEDIDSYADNARIALKQVIDQRGGIDAINQSLSDKKIIESEILRIQNETIKLSSKETNAEFVKTLITSNILPKEQVDAIINTGFLEFEAHAKDTVVNSKTIVFVLLGTAIASITGGILWGLQLIYARGIFLILIVGLALLCYGIIKFTTKKSWNNQAVLVGTVAAIVISILIGQVIYSFAGYSD